MMPYQKLMKLIDKDPMVKAIVEVRHNDLKRSTLQLPTEPKGFSIKERPQPGNEKDLRLALRDAQGQRLALGKDGVWPAMEIHGVEPDRQDDDYMMLSYRKLVDTEIRVGRRRFVVKAMVTSFTTEYAHQEIPIMGRTEVRIQAVGPPQLVTVRLAIGAHLGTWPTFYTIRGILWADKNLQDSQAGNVKKLTRQAQGFWAALRPAERRCITWAANVIKVNGRNALLGAPIPEDFRLRLHASQLWLALTAHEDDEYRHPVKVKNVCKYILGTQAFKTKQIEEWEARNAAYHTQRAEEERQRFEALDDVDDEPDCD